MLFDDVDPIYLDLVHDVLNENKIFLAQHGMIATSWSQNPCNYESNKPFI